MWSGRRSYYRDSYGRWHEDRDAGRGRGFRGKWGLISLLVLAAIIVLASLMQSAYHVVVPSPQGASSDLELRLGVLQVRLRSQGPCPIVGASLARLPCWLQFRLDLGFLDHRLVFARCVDLSDSLGLTVRSPPYGFFDRFGLLADLG